MSARAIVLHIGLHKTGTSSIQAACRQGRRALLTHRVIYPECLPANHSHFMYDAFSAAPEHYHANISRGRDKGEIEAAVSRTFEALAAEFAARPGDTILLSGEDACTFGATEIAQMRRTFDALVPNATFRVLLYTRHPIDFVTSAIQENVKGNGLTLARAKAIHIGATPNRYRRIFEAYAAVFGAESLVFRSFEKARATGLIADLLTALALPTDLLEEVRDNEGIADEVVRFLSEQNTPGVARLDPASLDVIRALPGSRHTLLTAEEKATIWHQAQNDLDFLRERFAITYEASPPHDATASGHYRFLGALSEVLPKLSVEARIAIQNHLAKREYGAMR